MLSCKSIPREIPIFCEDNINNKINNCYDKTENAILSPSSCKKILLNNFNSDEADVIDNHIWWNKPEKNKKNFSKTDKLKQRIFKFPNGIHSIRSKSPFVNIIEKNLVTNKICNTVENNSNILGEKCSRYKFNNLFKSSNNLYASKYDHSNEAKENIAFWENLKSIKGPITNTITLGRKFKKNVLKLSLFNNFNETNSKNMNDVKKIDENNPEDCKIPPLPSKSKKFKKKFKIRELNKEIKHDNDYSLINNKNDFFYRTI